MSVNKFTIYPGLQMKHGSKSPKSSAKAAKKSAKSAPKGKDTGKAKAGAKGSGKGEAVKSEARKKGLPPAKTAKAGKDNGAQVKTVKPEAARAKAGDEAAYRFTRPDLASAFHRVLKKFPDALRRLSD